MAEQQLPEDLVPIAGDPEPLAPVEDAVLSEAPTEAIEPTEANILDEERRKSRAARFNVPLAALVRFSEHFRFLQGRRSIVAQYLAFKIPLKNFSSDFLGVFALPTPHRHFRP
jgi:hypothetical protein